MKINLRFSILFSVLITIFFFFLFNLIHAQTWSQLFPTGDPGWRAYFTAVNDTTSNRMTIFGGYNGGFVNDVWVLSTANGLGGTPSWTQLSPTGGSPEERSNHTATYDVANNRMTIFGGTPGGNLGVSTYLNDVWVLSYANGLGGTASWTQLTTSATPPIGRLGHKAVYDNTNNIMIIFGGDSLDTILNDVWTLNNANGVEGVPTWTQLTVIGNAPTPRAGHSAVYDAANNRIIIFGGLTTNGDNGPYAQYYGENDVWVLSNANGLGGTPTWTQLSPNSDPIYGLPTGRWNHTATYDNVNNRMIIFGGENGNEFTLLNDTWVLSNANGLAGKPQWAQLINTGKVPPTRVGHTAVYDNASNRMTIFGGVSGGSGNDVWVLDGANGLPSPTFPNIPSLKLFLGQSIIHAFNLEDFNTGDIATRYTILSNFLNLSSLDSSSVNQNAYDSATTGTNIYLANNSYGYGPMTNEVKYSTYKIYKLPKVGLTVGSSWDVNVASYTYSSTGISIPPSFSNPDAITVTDTTLLTATWSGNTVIHLTSLQAFSGAVDVDVIASPNATAPFGIDIDKERIQVYTNLLTQSTFSTSNDTSIWMPLELAPGRTTLATQSWISTYTDSAGTQANGVWQFTFPDGNSGVKSTPMVSTWIPMSSGQWYTLRMRLVSDTPNNAHQSVLFGFNNYLGAGLQTDIAANVFFGIPTVWTWQETPLLVHSFTTTGYPQFQFKASTTGNIYIDEIQIINSVPTLVDANRGNTRLFYPYGFLTWNQVLGTGNSDTVGWGQEVYYGAGSAPGISVSNNSLQLDFSGASSGTGQQGIKWTANNGIQGSGHAFTQGVTLGREVGVRSTVTIQSGTFNSLGIILVAAYGVQTSGQQNIGVSPSNLVASAEVGTLVSGTYRTVATAINPYYQFQFGVRSDQSGILSLTNIDFDQDQDDPNFGDPSLFPE